MSAHAPASDHHAAHGGQAGHGDHAGGHGHHNAEYPFLAHHFETPAQQFDSAKLGMWLFLVTEVLFFGALFVAYAVLRARFPEVFKYASGYLDTTMGGINTIVLILSSLTMAFGVYFAQTGRKLALIVCLWLTMAGAAGFMVIKYFEYTHKFHVHLVWGEGFYKPVTDDGGLEAAILTDKAPAPVAPALTTVGAGSVAQPAASGSSVPAFVVMPAGEATAIAPPAVGPVGMAPAVVDEHAAAHAEDPATHGHGELHLDDAAMPPNTHLFFAIYYAMTGLHGIHVLIGMGVIGWLILRASRGEFGPKYYTPVDLVGLYWHIVDLVWIFLFPLFYLID